MKRPAPILSVKKMPAISARILKTYVISGTFNFWILWSSWLNVEKSKTWEKTIENKSAFALYGWFIFSSQSLPINQKGAIHRAISKQQLWLIPTMLKFSGRCLVVIPSSDGWWKPIAKIVSIISNWCLLLSINIAIEFCPWCSSFSGKMLKAEIVANQTDNHSDHN